MPRIAPYRSYPPSAAGLNAARGRAAAFAAAATDGELAQLLGAHADSVEHGGLTHAAAIMREAARRLPVPS